MTNPTKTYAVTKRFCGKSEYRRRNGSWTNMFKQAAIMDEATATLIAADVGGRVHKMDVHWAPR